MDEALHLVLARYVDKILSPKHVGAHELSCALNRSIDVTLSG